MRAAAVIAFVLLVSLAAFTAQGAAPPTLAEKLARSKQANRALRAAIDDVRAERDALQEERDAQDAVISDLQAENARLRARDPLDQVLARDADARWQAMIELWRVQPTLDEGSRCGYDRGQDTLADTYTSFSFYRWTLC
jgi:hypothetical protein